MYLLKAIKTIIFISKLSDIYTLYAARLSIFALVLALIIFFKNDTD
jgi:hypothetical protein